MAKFRKKPVVIEAVQWTGVNSRVIADFCYPTTLRFQGYAFDIPTLEGVMRASKGDWIVRGTAHELYPVKPDIFAATYEEV